MKKKKKLHEFHELVLVTKKGNKIKGKKNLSMHGSADVPRNTRFASLSAGEKENNEAQKRTDGQKKEERERQ